MGVLVNGTWCDEGLDTRKTNGHYVRPDSQFRDWVTADGPSAFPAAVRRSVRCAHVFPTRRYVSCA